ncbi:MAG: alpha/beta fold hydrolase [Bacteroides sp.]|nr:alpha/beta fold hydrolase [Bacteroides sp.]
MFRINILFILWVVFAWNIQAQTNEQRAKDMLRFTIEGQRDSIYTRSNQQIRDNVSPAVFSNTFQMLESQFGKYQSNGEWNTDSTSGTTIYYTDLQFEKFLLRFMAAFDEDGLANTIQLIPVSPVKSNEPSTQNTDVMEEKEIEIISGKYKLPGILSLPKGITHPPVVILVHGSGANDRDETLGPNKPFRDLAWGLSKLGIAVVRYDKRAYVYRTSEASPDFDEETVNDALSAIKMLKTNPEVNGERIYVAGHSLGASMAPRIAEFAGDDLAGIIMISGNARPLEDLIVEQMEYLSTFMNVNQVSEKQIEDLKKQAANVKAIGATAFDESIGVPLNVPLRYWEFSNKYKQVETAKKLKLPVLILQGERDYQVTMDDFRIWHTALSANPNVSFKSYPKLNHILQEGEGKSIPSEYEKASPVPDYVMKDIANWIERQN